MVQPQRVEYDDFDPSVAIPIAAPEPPQGPIAPDHRKIKHDKDRLEASMKLSLLVRLGIVRDRPDPIPREVVPKGQRKIAEFKSVGMSVLVPLKPWRRF